MRHSRSRRRVAASILSFALFTVGCNAASSPGASSQASQAAIFAPSVSLIPAAETSTPAPVETPGELPPVGPPSGVPLPPPGVTPDYQQAADDLAAFVAAYRQAFQVPELPEEAIAAAGARVCGYLQRHADASGLVTIANALTEAEINQPGFPREVWLAAFEAAKASYCREFTFDSEGQG